MLIQVTAHNSNSAVTAPEFRKRRLRRLECAECLILMACLSIRGEFFHVGFLMRFGSAGLLTGGEGHSNTRSPPYVQ